MNILSLKHSYFYYNSFKKSKMELPSILSNVKVNMSYLIFNLCPNNQAAMIFCLNNHLMATNRNCESCSHSCIKMKEKNTDEMIWRYALIEIV